MKPMAKNGILIVIVAVLAFAPLFLVRNGEFAGADDRAEKAISTIDANYKPWFKPLWEPPSGEVESILFALQAALGSGFVFYYLGYAKGKHSASKKDQA
ncbi:Additional substrate-specific component CbiN of cobalt ECF transporter [Desulfosporosinus sp. I2]|uniref:energy-coupling factor ABC transporter substrate-binding protein n=1 Tax=Desulfosporosinus sp. I2 TaxID=1617025 RepID=UPI0005F06005|nr:energy-coupling factor ABC transporter substrate-binding protein [Desulfosporosinus sp. I2]KJR48336.1 Additional substrate-specific component CbiN of cobalt ECF transporter [Desulfosporosinus sp. I2]